MKKTLLLSTLVVGIVMAGCNRQTRTGTTTDYAATPTTTDQTTTTTTTAPVDTTTTTADPMATTTVPRDTTTATTTRDTTIRDDMSRAADRTGDALSRAADRTGDAFSRAADRTGDAMQNLSARMQEWRLDEEQIRADIESDRPIVRTKDAAGAPVGDVDRSTLKTAVEGRIQADDQLANLRLDVDAKRGGEIELEGKAQNAQQVARAIALALDTDGVVKVTSKIKLDKDAQRR
jgi:hypothetical protein